MGSASDAAQAADVFQAHRDELGFVNRAQCEEKDLVTVEQGGEIVGAALANHCVRKPQTTLYDLAVFPDHRREGIATELVNRLADESPHEKIVAKCPEDLDANEFYDRTGWELIAMEGGKKRTLNVWEYQIDDSPDVITTGRPDLTEHASERGWLVGCRLDDIGSYERAGASVNFLDMYWEDPQPGLLLDKAAEHEPKYIVAGDYLRDEDNKQTVNDRAEQLREFCENVIVVPKSPGDLEHVPEWCVVGYSTPTRYGETDIKLRKYREIDQPIHILGGTPHQQFWIMSKLWMDNVVSLDSNSIHKAATRGTKAWTGMNKPRWRKLEGEDMIEPAYKESVENVTQEFEARGIKVVG